jgi:hypothetical protein
MKWNLLFVLSFFVGLAFAAPMKTIKISGMVIDQNGLPVEIVNVRVKGTVIGTNTDLQGMYVLNVSSTDSLTLIFSRLGYVTRKRLLLNPQNDFTLNVTLPTLGFELGEVTITEHKRQTNMTEILTMKDQKLMPDASGGNIEAMLATQAGVSSHNELSSQYSVRGGSFDENIVYVNGTEVYRPLLIRSGEQEGLSFINPDMVKEVAFSSGGYGARYGDKMSSVLDITYKKPEQNESSLSMSLLGGSAYVGLSKKHFTWTNGFRYKTSRYLLGSLETKGEYNPKFLDYQTYLNWTPNKKWDIGFIGNISENKYDFEPVDRETNFGTSTDAHQFKVYFEGAERDVFRTFFGSGNLTYHVSNRADITFRTSAFQTREQENYDITGQYWLSSLDSSDSESSDSETTGIGTYMEHARNRLTAKVLSNQLSGSMKIRKNEVLWGLEIRNEHVNDQMREWQYRDSAGYSLPHTATAVKLIYSLASKNSISSQRYAFYVQDTYKWSSSFGLFTLNPGIRGSYWNWNKEFIFSPRVSIACIPSFNEGFTFRLATGVYYQAPFYKEFRDTTLVNGIATVVLNKGIKSQRSLHFVAATDYNFRAAGRPFRFTVESYYKALSNLVPYSVDNLRIRYYGRNMSKGYAYGLDMKLFGEFVPGTDSWLSFSLMKTQEKLNGQWIPRPTDQRYNVSLYFTDYFPGNEDWKMSLKCSYAAGLPFGPSFSSGRESVQFRSPPYKRVDIGMSRRIASKHLRSCWLGLDIFNLLDNSNVNSYYWITGINDAQYAVPNYLTGRRINVRLLIEL